MYIKRVDNSEEIRKLLYEFDDSFFIPITELKNIEQYTEKLCKNAYVYVEIEQSKNVGLLVFYANAGKVSYLANLVIKKAYQGQQYGKKLMEFFIDFVKNKFFEKIRLEVDKKNKRAMQMYYKFGFAIEKEKNTDAWYMYKNV